MNRWRYNRYTDTGKIRTINEDAIVTLGPHGLWAVADGMGGHESGDYASHHLSNRLSQFRDTDTRGVSIARIDRLLSECNSHLVEKAANEQHDIIGCTVALLYIHGDQAYCVWSGDSRIYRLRGTQLRLLTRDHNYESLSLDRDVLSNHRALLGDEQMLTCAIGGDKEVELEHCQYTIKKDDQFLICTDGLYKEVSETEIEKALHRAQIGENSLVALARQYQDRGARDNIAMVHIFSEGH